jgi:hypothetical protein
MPLAMRLLPLFLVGCILQPLPEPPGTLEKVAALDTAQMVEPPSVLPPIEPWIPTLDGLATSGAQIDAEMEKRMLAEDTTKPVTKPAISK